MRHGVGEEKARLGANRGWDYFFIALEKSQEAEPRDTSSRMALPQGKGRGDRPGGRSC